MTAQSSSRSDGDQGGMELVRALYRASAAVADHHDPRTLEDLHVRTALDDFLVTEATARHVVFVTGNPGDGKTHLIRKVRDRFPAGVEVCLDANERPDDELLAMVDGALAAGSGLVVAINEGILLDLSSAALGRWWAAEVRRKLLRGVRYDGHPSPTGDERLRVIDLNFRNNLGREVVGTALDRLLALAVPCAACPAETCQAARNAERLRVAEVRQRLVDLLDTVGRSGVHATMRDLLGFLSFVLCGGENSCTPNNTHDGTPYYLNAFEGGVGPLFDAVRRFDPLRRPMPLLDDSLWRHVDRSEEWFVASRFEVRRGTDDQERVFALRKRRAFFEHRNGRGELERAGGEIDDLFREITDRRRANARRLVALINQFFDRGEAGEDLLILWTAHRYDARPTRYVAARWHISALQLCVCVPRLPPELAPAFPNYHPDHAVLMHRDLSPAEGLIVDRRLIEVLVAAHGGGPASRSGEPTARIAAFFDHLSRVARREWGAKAMLPQVRVLDTETGQKIVLGVDIETGSYVRV